jgi:hypothetical protein
VQPNAFLLPDRYLNSPLPCSDLPHLDLGRWEAVQREHISSAEDGEEAEILEALRYSTYYSA